MRRRRLLKLAAVSAFVPVLVLAGNAPVFGVDGLDADPLDPGYVIVGAHEGQAVGDAVFYPTGPISDDTVVVIAEPDGSLPGGLTESTLQALAAEARDGKATQFGLDSLGEGAFSVPDTAARDFVAMASATPRAYLTNGTSWSGIFSGGSIIGTTANTTVSYVFTAPLNTAQINAGQGRGYYRGYNGSQMGTWAQWYNLGTATARRTGGAAVPWGQVISTTAFRAACATASVCNGKWGP